MDTCKTCKFFIPTPDLGTDLTATMSGLGNCYRYPPTTSPRVFDPTSAQLAESMLTPSLAAFPLLRDDLWCGEYVTRPVKHDEEAMPW